jgi:hypothetical protein
VLTPIPPSRVLHEWDAISRDLERAFKRDPKRNWLDILGQAIAGELRFWKVTGGYLCTQVTRQPGTLKRTFWVIYAGGKHGYLNDWRALMERVELQALKERCSDLRFEGRDWRKVFPEYDAHKESGRWHFRKVLA